MEMNIQKQNRMSRITWYCNRNQHPVMATPINAAFLCIIPPAISGIPAPVRGLQMYPAGWGVMAPDY